MQLNGQRMSWLRFSGDPKTLAGFSALIPTVTLTKMTQLTAAMKPTTVFGKQAENS